MERQKIWSKSAERSKARLENKSSKRAGEPRELRVGIRKRPGMSCNSLTNAPEREEVQTIVVSRGCRKRKRNAKASLTWPRVLASWPVRVPLRERARRRAARGRRRSVACVRAGVAAWASEGVFDPE
eukprot:4011090-Pleurochrysis_carterae.AAC.2